jgi:TrmH family RNA methyltransferase
MTPTLITSQANLQVKSIRKLRERKERQETGLFFAEGVRITAEALQLNAGIQTLVAAPELLESAFARELVEEAHRLHIPVLEVSAAVFATLSIKEGPQGLGAVIRQQWLPLEQVTPAPKELWIALDAVADPGNLGTILRSGDSAGARGVILLDQSTDPYDPTSVRASMGAIFAQKLAHASLAEFSAWKRSCGCPVVGTSGAADLDYHGFAYPERLVLLMGSERQGLSAQHLAICDAVVRIPMLGRSDSLNLAAATAVVLYEIFNQRREKKT